MASSLVEFATRASDCERRLLLAESDHRPVGDAVCVLLEDPTDASPAWPAAISAYSRIWSGYKSYEPVMAVPDLLEHVLQSLRDDPGLVAAVCCLSGRQFHAWALPGATVLAQSKGALYVLVESGFAPVTPQTSVPRPSSPNRLLASGRLPMGAGDLFLLTPRAHASRIGFLRAEHALATGDPKQAMAALAPDGSEESLIIGRLDPKLPTIEQTVSRPERAARRPVSPSPKAGAPTPAPPRTDAVANNTAGSAAQTQLELEAPATEPIPAAAMVEAAVPEEEVAPPAERQPRPPADPVIDQLREDLATGEATPPPQKKPDLWVRGRHAERQQRPKPPAEEKGPEPERAAPASAPFTDAAYPEESLQAEADRTHRMILRGLTWLGIAAGAVFVLSGVILLSRWLNPGDTEEALLPNPAVETARTPTVKEEAPPPVPPVLGAGGASWSRTFDKAVTSSPALAGDRVVFGARDGRVYALAANSGETQWSTPLGAGIGASPLVADGLVVIGNYAGRVVALSVDTGETIWDFATGAKVVASATLAADGATVIAASHDQQVYGLALADGSLRWKVQTGGAVFASPVVDGDNRVFVATMDGTLHAIDAAAGEPLWQAQLGSAIYSSPAVWHDRVAVGSTGRAVRCFRAADGANLWSTATDSPVAGSVAATEQGFLVGDDSGRLVHLAADDGSELWSLATGGPIKSWPRVAGDVAWVTSYDSQVRVVDLAGGEELWSFDANGKLFSSPLVVGRTAFFGSMVGQFYAATWPLADAAGL